MMGGAACRRGEMDDASGAGERTDWELVLGCWPDARVVSRPNPAGGAAEYRIEFQVVSGRHRPRADGWFPPEEMAWQVACARLGLRGRTR